MFDTLNTDNSEECTALHYAARAGNVPIIKELIHHGADIEIKTAKNESPLQIALESKHFEIARELINHGAKVNVRFKFNQTPWGTSF